MTDRKRGLGNGPASLISFIVGVVVGTIVCVHGYDLTPRAGTVLAQDAQAPIDLVTMARDLQELKAKAPDQAHAMADVDYHYTNLWFAAGAQNWPLAEFYWKETLSHMHWAVRIIPVRKDNAGREIILADILQAIEQTPQMQVGKTIERQDLSAFQTAYRNMLEGCYNCHKAADKPYLRPQVPDEPASNIINFNPQATWPR